VRFPMGLLGVFDSCGLKNRGIVARFPARARDFASPNCRE
jgi:hypothetical protein